MSNFRGAFQSRLHLGNEKKNKFFLCISLDLHYLCTRIK